MATEKGTTTLNKVRVEQLLSYIAQTFYKISDNETQQGLFEAWKTEMFQGKSVPLLDTNDKIEIAYFPDYVLSRMVFGGTVNGQDLATVSEHFKAQFPRSDDRYSTYYQDDNTVLISNENSKAFEGVYFLADDVSSMKAGGILDNLNDADKKNPVQVGDWIVSIGSRWAKIDNTDAVRTVLNLTGNITAKDIRDLAFAVETDLAGAMWYKNGDAMVATATSEFGRSLLNASSGVSFTGLTAEKATKLETPRTIWGNTFDGSGSIGGSIVPLEDNASDIGNASKRFRDLFLNRYIVLNTNSEGIYLSGGGINWHDASNAYAKTLLSFTKDGLVHVSNIFSVGGASNLQGSLRVVGATTLNSTLNVGGLSTLDSLKVNNDTTLGSNISTSKLTVDAVSTFNGDVTIADGKQTLLGGTLQVKGATTLNSTLSVTGASTFNGDVTVANGKQTTLGGALQVKGVSTFDADAMHNAHIILANGMNLVGKANNADSPNTSLVGINSDNTMLFGYGGLGKYHTNIYGKTINFYTKAGESSAQFDDDKNLTVYGAIAGIEGVSAKGIVDFSEGGSSGGAGGAHYDLEITQNPSNITLQLLGDDGDVDTKTLSAFSTSQSGVVPYAPSTNSLLFGSGWRALQASDIPELDWSKITTGKPTTISGYGITDAFLASSFTKSNIQSTLGISDWALATSKPSYNFSELDSKPTTISGFGITDAYTKSEIDNGYFTDMRVGLADDLGDIEEPLDVEYTFQPTANPNEIRDGYAQIESLKGNSVVWNQLVNKDTSQSFSSNGLTGSYKDGYWSYTGIPTRTAIALLPQPAWGVGYANHKMIIITNGTHNFPTLRATIYGDTTVNVQINSIFTCPFDSQDIEPIASGLVVGTEYTAKLSYQLIDLTQMFGEGNEPTTEEEFYARCPKGMSMDYNEGEVIHFNADAVKSVGFNQWDEEWELGQISSENGLLYPSSNTIRSRNYISVIPKLKYFICCKYFSSGNVRTRFYDESKNYIGFAQVNGNPIYWNREFTIPDNAHYLKFEIQTEYGTTYNNDICINISDEDKNGTYEPYTEFRRDLPTELFEGGMKSAGTAYDEVYWDEAKNKYIKVTRIGKVDLGTLAWHNLTQYNYGYRTDDVSSFMKTGNLNYILSKDYKRYTNPSLAEWKEVDKAISNGIRAIDPTMWGDFLVIKDSACINTAAFKEAIQGVMLYYELAEPIIEEIDIPYMDYEVSNDGTEEVISDTPTTPIKARVVYNFDTIGTVKQNRFDVSNLKDSISLINSTLLAHSSELGVINTAITNLQGATTDLGKSIENTNKTISQLAKGEGVSGHWVLDGLKIGTYDVLHAGNTSLTIDSGDDFGFTLKVGESEIQMSDITESELVEMINAAWGTTYEQTDDEEE